MVNVAILGFGTVGSGVAEVLAKNGEHIDQKVETPVRLKYILDVRDFPESPFQDKIIHDFSTIENDKSVDIVVETIGGATVALDYTRRALRAGKSVVSSNKELVAERGYELIQLASQMGVSYLFEASVGGGIPILRPLSQCLAANELTEICGILNGTTNYILTRMIRAGLSFEAALKEAQENGYAEKDPTADVEGHDACRKICILASIAFGRPVYPRQVPTEGITGVTLADVAYAESVSYTHLDVYKRQGIVKQKVPDGDVQHTQAHHGKAHDGAGGEGHAESLIEALGGGLRGAGIGIGGNLHADKTGQHGPYPAGDEGEGREFGEHFAVGGESDHQQLSLIHI